jgi:hypothetical protein
LSDDEWANYFHEAEYIAELNANLISVQMAKMLGGDKKKR